MKKLIILIILFALISCAKQPIAIYSLEHRIYPDSTESIQIFKWNYDSAKIKTQIK